MFSGKPRLKGNNSQAIEIRWKGLVYTICPAWPDLVSQGWTGAPEADVAQVAMDGQGAGVLQSVVLGPNSRAGPMLASCAPLVKTVSWSPVVHMKPCRGH